MFEPSPLDKVKFTEKDEVTYLVVIKEGDVKFEKLEIERCNKGKKVRHGEDNIFADFLSRNSEGKFQTAVKENELVIATLQNYTVTEGTEKHSSFSLIAVMKAQGWEKKKFAKIGEKQRLDAVTKKYFDMVANGEKTDSFQIYNGVLFHKDKKK